MQTTGQLVKISRPSAAPCCPAAQPPPLLALNLSFLALQVWPKAVDCDLFHPSQASSDMRARLAGGSPASPAPRLDGPLLLYVGRVSPEKNLALLRPLLERVPGARLAVVGDGPAMQVRPACKRAGAACPAD